MSGKRRAGTELNADNWDDVEETEEAGTFRMASDRDLQNRVIKTAKRRSHGLSEEAKKGIFSSFGGFNKTPATSTESPFAFLTSMKNGKSDSMNTTISKEPLKSVESKSEPSQFLMSSKPQSSESKSTQSGAQESSSKQSSLKYSDEYCSHLKELNQSICEWIKQNVEKNPYCILTPIFEDYKKYLKDFDKYKDTSKPLNTTSSVSMEVKDIKKPSETSQSIKDNIFSGVITSQSSLFQTPKPADKKELTSPPTTTFTQGFSSTPVSKAPLFSFTQNTPITSSSNFTFGTGQPFKFQTNNVIPEESKQEDKQQDGENDEEDEPPQVSFTPVVEENNVYSKRCKVYVTVKGQYSDRGVGTLYIKPIPNNEKHQLIVRADTSLGNLLMNIVLSKSIPIKRMGKNNVLLVTVPTPESKPPPVPVLLRVKTSEDADELLETLEKYQK